MSLPKMKIMIFILLGVIAAVIACGGDDEENDDDRPDAEGDDDDGYVPGQDDDDPDFWDHDDDADDDADDDVIPTTTTTVTSSTTSTSNSMPTTTTTTTTTSTTTTTQEPALLWTDDFESYPAGDLKDIGVPWEVVDDFDADGVRSTAAIADFSGNQKLEIIGLALPFFFITLQNAFEDHDGDMMLKFKFRYDAVTDDLKMKLCRRGPLGASIDTAEIQVLNGRIYAKNGNLPGLVDCGPINTGYEADIAWRLEYNGTYDILINDTQSACSGLSQITDELYPFGFIRILESADDGYGGAFLFDEFEAWDLGG